MRRLFIVDDEEIIRDGMARLFDWQAMGYETALFPDGEAALAEAQKTPPDIVLTDIYMPRMGGLELARELMERGIFCAVVLLSGYNEFTYAQEAIELGVFRYLTKPIDESKLLETLLQTEEFISTRSRERERVRRMQELMDQSLPLLQERFLKSLVKAPGDKREALERAERLGLTIDYPFYQCMLFSIGRGKEWEAELIQFAVQSIAADFFEEIGCGLRFFERRPGELGVICGYAQKPDQLSGALYARIQEMQGYVRRYLGVTLTVSLSSPAGELARLPEAFREAQRAMEFKPSAGEGAILLIEEFQSPQRNDRLLFAAQTLLSRAEGELKNGNLPGAREQAQKLCGLIRGTPDVTREQLQVISMEAFLRCRKLALSFGDGQAPAGSPQRAVEVDSVEGLEALLTELIERSGEFVAKKRRSTVRGFVEKAKRFIRENYMRSELSLTVIAKNIFVSPAYLSQTFKQTEGVSCIEYLTRVRMDNARRLLRETADKTYEIALRVGFCDPQYFSTCFKKTVGVSPTEYRNQIADPFL